ncbi:scramblase 1 [Carabus blaptoides fortunei]
MLSVVPYVLNTWAHLTSKPVTGGWMNTPKGGRNCPSGLEYLTTIDEVLIHQKVEMLEVRTGFESINKFMMKNGQGQLIYYAIEDSNWLTRKCCGRNRAFDMNIMDKHKNHVIHFSRPNACDSCCFPYCLQSIAVSAPPGNIIGTVHQEWSIFRPWFTIRNPVGICGDVQFRVLSADRKHRIGVISKQWSGTKREIFMDADYFQITFPMNLDVKMKATMMGACILIDAMYFESTD